MKQNITVIIHSYNEEKNIKECIESAHLLTDQVILIDMQSCDNTTKIAKEMGVKILQFPYSTYVEPARKFGIREAQTDWIFILDADERLTERLTKEIKKIVKQDQKDRMTIYCYFKVSRKNIFGKKKWLRHGGWWPDQQIRLINKIYFQDWPKEIHSTPIINGTMGFLENPIIHLFHGDFHKMVEKTVIFEQIEADLLFKANKNSGTLIFFRKFYGELMRRLIKHLGFLDGSIGIIESVYQAFSKTITYLYLYEKKKGRVI